MRLSKRIYKIADMVQPGETAADIGTDHGYVPMLLIMNNISPHVIMSDISEGSLAKACETFRLCSIEADPSDFRIGNGLSTVQSGEVDAIIIGGLGGFTIIDILQSDLQKSRSFSHLILQPRKHSGNLRYFLYTHGWDITDESLAPEGKFVCEIISAVYSGVESRTAPYPENDIRWKYPKEIINADPVLASKRISWKIGSINEQIDNLSRSRTASDDVIERLMADRLYLKSLLEQCCMAV